MPKFTPAQSAIGCANLLTILGGFGMGVKIGFAHAQGVAISPGLENTMLYGPSLLSGFLGYKGSKELISHPDNVDELASMQMDSVPSHLRDSVYQTKRQFITGCFPTIMPIACMGLTAAATTAGYYLGRTLAQ